ncbi:uncharacterized protein LOC114260798 [Camellia sinensis]|uniref:uncharacterized protein LOC114260798 n=1 Tax=Camellia sinensis TaxID=4442 RepID=UPI00103605C5|nr:uncharacterized protein LOC114260798 [Camellia sinensis]
MAVCYGKRRALVSLYFSPNSNDIRGVDKMIWENVTPPKVICFAWLAWRQRLKTATYLQRACVINGNANMDCVFCNAEPETVNHVLLWCPHIWRIWSDVLLWWGIHWVMPESMEGVLLWWSGFTFNKFEQKIWKALPLVILWSIWKLRNVFILGKQPDSLALCNYIKTKVAMWVRASSPGVPFFVNDLVFNLRQFSFWVRN